MAVQGGYSHVHLRHKALALTDGLRSFSFAIISILIRGKAIQEMLFYIDAYLSLLVRRGLQFAGEHIRTFNTYCVLMKCSYKFMNDVVFYWVVLTVILYSGFVFGAIRLFDRMPWFVTGIWCFWATIVFIVSLSVFRTAASFNVKGMELLRRFRKEAVGHRKSLMYYAKGKIFLKQVDAVKAPAVPLGVGGFTFLVILKATTAEIMSYVVETSISVLLTVQPDNLTI